MSDKLNIPPVLTDFLRTARKDLKEKGEAPVVMTTPVVRAIYSLSTALNAARDARDRFRTLNTALRKELVSAQRAARDQDLLNNRAVLNLLEDVDRLLTGEETSVAAAHAAHEKLQKYIKRGRGAASKRKSRASPGLDTSLGQEKEG
jgi:predicted phage gp36 major capsid-like protein